MKYIYILKLLAQDPDTGEMQWVEKLRFPDLEFTTCITQVVDTTVQLSDMYIRHHVYCTTKEIEAKAEAKAEAEAEE